MLYKLQAVPRYLDGKDSSISVWFFSAKVWQNSCVLERKCMMCAPFHIVHLQVFCYCYKMPFVKFVCLIHTCTICHMVKFLDEIIILNVTLLVTGMVGEDRQMDKDSEKEGYLVSNWNLTSWQLHRVTSKQSNSVISKRTLQNSLHV